LVCLIIIYASGNSDVRWETNCGQELRGVMDYDALDFEHGFLSKGDIYTQLV